jgi:hypothetical protein
MIWPKCPSEDGEPAEWLIGQPDFTCEGRNAKTSINAATLNVPTGIAASDNVLAIADAWNHRVLIWHSYPQRSNQPADVVLGQANFLNGAANRGADRPSAATLNWCYGVTISEGRMFVADTGNRRMLMWEKIPSYNGQPADLVLGQRDFLCRDENAGEGVGAVGMRWPHAVAYAQGMIMVADAGNNRVMVWRKLPAVNGAACDFVIGQKRLQDQDNNGGAYAPNAASLNMPYGLTLREGEVVIADTANSRLVGFPSDTIATGAHATRLWGQRRFTDKGDNRRAPVSRDSLCWPYGISACRDRLIVADSGNNRVLLLEIAPW